MPVSLRLPDDFIIFFHVRSLASSTNSLIIASDFAGSRRLSGAYFQHAHGGAESFVMGRYSQAMPFHGKMGRKFTLQYSRAASRIRASAAHRFSKKIFRLAYRLRRLFDGVTMFYIAATILKDYGIAAALSSRSSTGAFR